MATLTGITVVKSASGWLKALRRMKTAMPMFWIPASMEMAKRSSYFCRNSNDASQPTRYPTHGNRRPVTAIYNSFTNRWNVVSTKFFVSSVFSMNFQISVQLTRHVNSLNRYKFVTDAKITTNVIKITEHVFRIRTRNCDTRGQYRWINNPIESGMIRLQTEPAIWP